MPASDSLVGAALKPSPYEELRQALTAVKVAPDRILVRDIPAALAELDQFRDLRARYLDG